MEWIVLILIGLVSGTLGSIVGLGGGIIIVPALLTLGTYTTLINEITPQQAVGTSLVIMIFTGLSSTLAYMKQKQVDYRSGLIFFIGSGPGAIIGAWVNKWMKLDDFQLYFGIFVIFISFVLMIRNKIKPLKSAGNHGIKRTFVDSNGNEYQYGYHLFLAIFISFIVGFCSGIFGIGGGSLMVPAMIIIFAFPPHVAVATSMLMIFLSSLVSSTTHIILGNVVWLYAAALIPGAWIGAKLGAFLNAKLKSNTVVTLLRLILIIVGIRLISEGIAG
ncbi:putative membrane protein YfcA [Oikeobacillus pervagus]|uniref:Probable membrane transporter protein n=1 Tax=Oikeobacillus pervagus TaxID=1325931 RepID=A0AAJ1SYI6_9BACI|nr:sulfite exporter TauE/SafE family protein [Oikeobacillus pervagus]MDQ0215155.1 putative membrane protein YfcA [Oikeobacillus pervagus]